MLVCGDYPADIAFLIDSSGSEYGSNFDNEKNFVSMVANEFNYGNNDTLIAVTQFSTFSHTEIYFNQYPDKAGLMDAIAKIHWLNGESNTHLGLTDLYRRVFISTNHNIHTHGHHFNHVTYGPRDASAKIAIVLTDGRSLEPTNTQRAAEHLHKMGVEVFAIGIGKSVDRNELRMIATDSNHVYEVPSTNDLEAIHTTIVDAICKRKEYHKPPPPFTPFHPLLM